MDTQSQIYGGRESSSMGEIQVHRRIVPWGNGYGIRLSKADLERLGLQARDEAEVVIRAEKRGLDLSGLRFLKLGGLDPTKMDDELGEGLDADR